MRERWSLRSVLMVANVSTERFVDPDDPLREICLVEAWSTLWERWFSGPHTQAARLKAEGGKPLTVLYSENDGTEAPFISRESRWPPAA